MEGKGEKIPLVLFMCGTTCGPVDNTMQVDGKIHILKEGDAIFINRNLLHITSDLPETGRYISINFPDKLLGFFAGSRMERNYVIPFTNHYCFPAIVFQEGVKWQKRIMKECVEESRQRLLNQSYVKFNAD